MQRLQRLTVAFAVLFAFFILVPPFLSAPLAGYPLMNVQEVVDLFTPLVLIPVYWLVFRAISEDDPGPTQTIVFLILAALWVEGQGMHLSANSIGHLTEVLAGSAIAGLTNFYDEVLSHYLWHAATMGLAALLMFRQWRHSLSGRSSLGSESGAGVLHGLNFSLMVLEGQTTPLGVPFAALAAVFGILRGRGRMRQQPVLAFFTVAFAVATVVFLVWWLSWGCFMEPLHALKVVFGGQARACP
jgi:hypothetical protein